MTKEKLKTSNDRALVNGKSKNLQAKDKDIIKKREALFDKFKKAKHTEEAMGIMDKLDKIWAREYNQSYRDFLLDKYREGKGNIQKIVYDSTGSNNVLLYELSIRLMREQFAKEYDVKTIPEHMLLDRAMNNYHTSINLDIAIKDILAQLRYNTEIAKIINTLSSAKEREERGFRNCLETLKRIKTPPINVKVSRTESVNIAEKQQVNIGDKPPEPKAIKDKDTIDLGSKKEEG